MDTVRTKFRCTSKTVSLATKRGEKQFYYEYKFQAVIEGSEENRSFFAFTPSGSVELYTVKDDSFEIGAEYYLDFIPVATTINQVRAQNGLPPLPGPVASVT